MTRNDLSSPPSRTVSWRAGARVLLGFVILYAAVWVIRFIMGVGPNLLMRWFGASENFRAYIGSTLNYDIGIISYIVLPAFALRKVLSIDPWPALFPFHKGWWRDLLFGFTLVTVILSSFFLAEVKAGWLVIENWTWQVISPDAFLRTAWVGLLVNISVAIGEEAIFRGYLLTGLKSASGKWLGVLVMMIIFGLFHLPVYSGSGGMHSWTLTLAIILATLFGGLFGLIYLKTKSLWLPISLHFTWNLIENDVLNLTGETNNVNLIGARTHLLYPLTMNKLTFGNVVFVEGLAFLVISLCIWLWLRNRQGNDPHLST